MTRADFDDRDREQLEQRGVELVEAERQLASLRAGGRKVGLLRPCTVGDGILRLDPTEQAELPALHDVAALAGRMLKFVPASGAATRMFSELAPFQSGPGRELSWTTIVAAARDGQAEAAALVSLLEHRRCFAFHDALAECLAQQGEELDGLAATGAFQPILDALLDPAGLGYAALPKGLLPFHSDGRVAVTPLEEHLALARATLRDRTGRCRVHLTVSCEHRSRFEGFLGALAAREGTADCAVGLSVQEPATDTLALDARGAPLRDTASRLVLRPSGHGALIDNLAALDADIVFIKNIDNVQPERRRGPTLAWTRVLGGLLVRTEREVFARLARLAARDVPEAVIDEVESFVRERLGLGLDGRVQPRTFHCRRASLIDRLNRPLRVAGVVRNTGEPGGGPFWVSHAQGSLSRQIVERAQVAPDRDQQRILEAATHFNPVDIVCGLRDAEGRPFVLPRFVDPDTAIVSRKSVDGREATVLERPGLWNGAMAGWNTLFVEVPLETFTPVKSVLDLLRPEHR